MFTEGTIWLLTHGQIKQLFRPWPSASWEESGALAAAAMEVLSAPRKGETCPTFDRHAAHATCVHLWEVAFSALWEIPSQN